jgi:peptidyl-prolyl cis-trans isomerase NIMA-interacting 1
MANNHSAANTRTEGMDASDGKIRAAHLLVKHNESRRPKSWREADITRSKDEALDIIKGYQEQIQSGQTTLGDLAVSESDCSSARKRGDLGFFGKNEMQKEFEENAFALKPGEVSGIVETASGFHLIERSVMKYPVFRRLMPYANAHVLMWKHVLGSNEPFCCFKRQASKHRFLYG